MENPNKQENISSNEDVVPRANNADMGQVVNIPHGQTSISRDQVHVFGDNYNIRHATYVQPPKDGPGSFAENLKYVEDLAEELKTFYLHKMCKKQLFPWESDRPVDLNDVYVQLTIDMEIPKPGTTIKKRLKFYHQIFDDTEEHRRFILEGRPGLGKSTLCSKIAYDWSHRHGDSNSPLKHIKLLFILGLGKIDHRSNIEDEIIRQLLHAPDSQFRDQPERLRKAIEICGKSVVIVLDALDESPTGLLRHEALGSIARILEFETLRRCRVLVTSRPWRVEGIMKLAVYRRLELQPFNKQSILTFVKQYFAVDPLLGKRLSRLIEDNELLVDASVPLITLLICWYWQKTKGKNGIPKRRSELYDAIIDKMYLSSTTTRRTLECDLRHIMDKLCAIALQGLDPTTEPKLAFRKNEIVETCSEDVIRAASSMGLVSEKRDNANSFIFFHKSGQEHLAGKFLASHPEDMRRYLSSVKTIDDALASGLVLISAARAGGVADVIESLMKLSDKNDAIDKNLHLFCKGKLSVEKTKRIQQFIELCLECIYEADVKGEFNEELKGLFTNGQVYCFGIQPYPAVALGYYMKHCDSWIRSLSIQPVAHPRDPQIFYGPSQRSYRKKCADLKIMEQADLERLTNDYLEHQKELHEDLRIRLAKNPMSFVAYIDSIQQCEGLPSTTDTNLRPIINNLQHIKLQKLSMDNFKLESNFDDFIEAVNNGHMESLTHLWAQSVASSADQTTELVQVIDKMPKLEDLGIHRNELEPGKTLPILGEKLAKCQNLQELSITHYSAPAEDMEDFARKLPGFASKLRVLLAMGNNMNDDVATCLSTNLPETLTYLGIDVCNLSHEKHNELLLGLHRLLRLEKLRLYDSPYPSDMVECVGSGLVKWIDIKEFTLTYKPNADQDKDIPEISEKACKAMEESVESAHYLEAVRLFGIRLPNKRFKKLIKIVGQNTDFRYLRYSRSCLSKKNADLCSRVEFVILE